MSTVREAAEGLAEALAAGLAGVVNVATDPFQPPNNPSLVLGPPALEWQAVCSAPTSARFPAYLVVDQDDRAMEKLWDLVPQVAEIVDGLTEAVVIRADPRPYEAGGSQLPAYLIQIEVSL